MGIQLHEIKDDRLRRRLRAALDSAGPVVAAGVHHPIVEPRSERHPSGPHCPKDGSGPRLVLRVVRRACRLVDADNLGGAKFVVDAIRRAGLVPDDSPETIELLLTQEKVATRDEEGTLIEIYPAETT